MKVNERGIGDLIDEAITLSFKVTHGSEKALDRLDAISNFIAKKYGVNHNLSKIIDLLIINAYCWKCQDEVSLIETTPFGDYVESALMAQKFNKTRNQVIGQLNGNKGIVTEKTY